MLYLIHARTEEARRRYCLHRPEEKPMRAIVIEEPGGPDVMKVGEVPEPLLGAGELLVAVRAAGVNRADLLQRMGRYPPPPGESGTLGLEVAGEVIAVAPDAAGRGPLGQTFRVGDRVMALLAGGGYAERVRVPAAQALPIPPQLSMAEAAAIPEAFLTAWLNLMTLGQLAQGDVAVIHAAASGVGTAALQLCRGVASQVVATASNGKLASLAQYGATQLVDRNDVPTTLSKSIRATLGKGADVILDLVGASYLAANIEALALHGRLVCIATQGGAKAELDLAALLFRRLTVIGSTLRSRTAEQKAALCAEFAERALPRFSRGELQPVLARTFPLAEASAAHALLARNAVVGKIVLEL